MSEINYQFRQRLLQVHEPNRRKQQYTAGMNQVEIDSTWKIVLPEYYDKVMECAARDLEDYFFTSMNLCIPVVLSKQQGDKVICYCIDENLSESSFCLTVTGEEVTLCGKNSRMAAQAGYYLEDLMNLVEAPVLDVGSEIHTALYSPRMIHSGFGLDIYPDAYLQKVAHSGVDAILVFVKDVDITPFGYLDFNDLCYRAERYGLDVYAYSYHKNEMHPEDPGAEEFYENLYGRLFARCPGLKGIVFVGESCEFPSKDPHTIGATRYAPGGTGQYTCVDGKWSPGWWPCNDFPAWLEMLKKVICSKRADADIVLWSYNWGRQPEAPRLELIRNLPKDISLLVTFEMYDKVLCEGKEYGIADYSLSFAGPSAYFTSEAKAAKERGVRLYAMTNTGGMTWDFGTIPYEPAPYQWMRRYDEMRKAHDQYGLSGIMESHHYGFYPSFISELAKWAFYTPTPDLDDILHKIAARDFTEAFADTVCQAYMLFSEGIRYCLTVDQYGPVRIGPSYPFLLDENVTIPSPPYAHYGGNTICYPMYRNISMSMETEEHHKIMDHMIHCQSKMADYYLQGCQMLEQVVDQLPDAKKENAVRILNLCKFIYRSILTAIHIKQWHREKMMLKRAKGAEREEIAEKLREIGRKEIENARKTIPYVENDSRLGYEPSMEYMCDKEHLEWKIALTQHVLEIELEEYLQQARKED